MGSGTHAGAGPAWRYGLMGLPLAFVALPLYVLLPNHYARAYGVPLASLGALLLATRLADALVDPLLGRLGDRLYRHSAARLLAAVAVACVLMGAGLALLFFPPLDWVGPGPGLLAFAGVLLVLTYAAFSTVTLAHQGWGARLGGGAGAQSRLVAWREGLGLVGVLLASMAPALWGLPAMVGLFWAGLVLGWLAWRSAPRPPPALDGPAHGALRQPWRSPAFRRLLAVFVVNGIASAVPATLVLFFVQDRLQAPPAWEPLFLGSYFLSAALSMPLWLAAVRRFGLARGWLAGMGLAVAVFVWAAALGAGDALPFIAICVLSGATLGADLVMPGAMLAALIGREPGLARVPGACFGWWNLATKLNLALAAGLALPLLDLAGYRPGVHSAQAQQALTIAYCLLPCALKLGAGGLLYGFFIHRRSGAFS